MFLLTTNIFRNENLNVEFDGSGDEKKTNHNNLIPLFLFFRLQPAQDESRFHIHSQPQL